MPLNILRVNTLDHQNLSLPCSSVATVTLHITLRDPSNVTVSACEIDRNNPQVALDGPGTSAPRILEAYGQPEDAEAIPGQRSLRQVCDSQNALAGQSDQ